MYIYNVHLISMAFVSKTNRQYTKGVPLSSDLRQLIINEMEQYDCDKLTRTVPYGIYSKVARHFCVSESCVRKLWKQYCLDSTVSPKPKGFHCGEHWLITREDEDYIVMLLNADLTIYRSEIHDLLLSHSNTLEDISLTTIK